MHDSELPRSVVAAVTARRGRLHPFTAVDPRTTALVVVDMQNAFCAPGAPLEVPMAREIVVNINALAAAIRRTGGTVVWVQMTIPTMADWPVYLDEICPANMTGRVLASLQPGSEGHALWPALEVAMRDMVIFKDRFSAFLPGACTLSDDLRHRGIKTVLITGTLTNVCCESSARDAAMQDFRTIMIADGNATRSDAEHTATLITFIQSFGDVRSTGAMIALLEPATVMA